MALVEQFRIKMNEALKKGDKKERSAYSNMVVALDNKARDLRVKELTPQQEIEVLTKLVKKNIEVIAQCKAGHEELRESMEYENSVFSKYLPKPLTDEELRAVINEVLTSLNISNPTPKDKGKIMKALMPKVKGRAEGKKIQEILSESF